MILSFPNSHAVGNIEYETWQKPNWARNTRYGAFGVFTPTSLFAVKSNIPNGVRDPSLWKPHTPSGGRTVYKRVGVDEFLLPNVIYRLYDDIGETEGQMVLSLTLRSF